MGHGTAWNYSLELWKTLTNFWKKGPERNLWTWFFCVIFLCFVSGTTNPASCALHQSSSGYVSKLWTPNTPAKLLQFILIGSSNRVFVGPWILRHTHVGMLPRHPSQCNGSSSAAKMMSSLEGEFFFPVFFFEWWRCFVSKFKSIYVDIHDIHMYIFSILYLFGLFKKRRGTTKLSHLFLPSSWTVHPELWGNNML